MLKFSIVKPNLSNIMDFFIRKQSFSLISNNIVKICYNKLDYQNWSFFLAWFFFALLNLNNKDKKYG